MSHRQFQLARQSSKSKMGKSIRMILCVLVIGSITRPALAEDGGESDSGDDGPNEVLSEDASDDAHSSPENRERTLGLYGCNQVGPRSTGPGKRLGTLTALALVVMRRRARRRKHANE